MGKEKLGQESIFPTIMRQIGDNEFRIATEKDLRDQYAIIKHFNGMSTRLFIATMAMQGLIAAGYTNEERISEQAFLQADKLLEKENEQD